MKNTILTFIIILLSILSIYLGIKLYSCKHKALPQATSSLSLDSTISVQPTLTYTDSEGNKHVVIDSRVNQIIENESTQAAIDLAPSIEQAALNLGIKPNQIEGVTTVSTEVLRDSVKFLTRQLESSQKLTYFYKDKYLTLSVHTNPKDSTDLGNFDYKYNADLNYTQYYKRNWFLGAKKSYIDFSLSDSNATIKGVKRLTVIQKEPEFGLRISATARYGFLSNSLSVGPSASFDISALKGTIRTSYLYNTQNKQWGLGISFDKDILRIK